MRRKSEQSDRNSSPRICGRDAASPTKDYRFLHSDRNLLIIDKPAGVAVDAPRGGGASIEQWAASCPAPCPSIVHRLDRDTSGCLLLAKGKLARKLLGEAFAQNRIDKIYLAVIRGAPRAPSGEIAMALGKVSSAEKGWRMRPDPHGKAAITQWSILDQNDDFTLLALFPMTGRTHQLRAHLAYGLGMPIIGDSVYADPDGTAHQRGAPGALGLHARQLRLTIPEGLMQADGGATSQSISATAPMPDQFAAWGFGESRVAARERLNLGAEFFPEPGKTS